MNIEKHMERKELDSCCEALSKAVRWIEEELKGNGLIVLFGICKIICEYSDTDQTAKNLISDCEGCAARLNVFEPDKKYWITPGTDRIANFDTSRFVLLTETGIIVCTSNKEKAKEWYSNRLKVLKRVFKLYKNALNS